MICYVFFPCRHSPTKKPGRVRTEETLTQLKCNNKKQEKGQYAGVPSVAHATNRWSNDQVSDNPVLTLLTFGTTHPFISSSMERPHNIQLKSELFPCSRPLRTVFDTITAPTRLSLTLGDFTFDQHFSVLLW